MKKFFWIVGTVIACILWEVIVIVILEAKKIVTSIVTHTTMQSFSPNEMLPGMVLGWMALVILSIFMWKRLKKRCQNCKRWGAVKRIQIEELKQDAIYVPVKIEHRDSAGRVTSSHDQYIPGKRTTYRDTYKCKYCGHSQSSTRTVDSKDI